MIITYLNVTNWRNFREVDVPLSERQFIVGPNASGKSNFIDIFRFIHDIVNNQGGGLQHGVKVRGGIQNLRSLVSEKDADIKIDVRLADSSDSPESWRYAIGFREPFQAKSHSACLTFEKVWRKGKLILNRSATQDEKNPDHLIQSALEGTEYDIKELRHFFRSITYLQLIPQLYSISNLYTSGSLETEDGVSYSTSILSEKSFKTQFGQGLIEKIACVDEKKRNANIQTIEDTLKKVVPQLERLEFTYDEKGQPHLALRSSHWHPNSPLQYEDQFSDGTLRLITLMWTLLESESLLLLEDPEQSLHVGIVSQLAYLIYRMQSSKGQQVFISTHSDVLLAQPEIDGTEVLMLTPTESGTAVSTASDNAAVRQLLASDFTVGEVVPSKSDLNNGSKMIL